MLMLYIFWDMIPCTLINTYLSVCSILPRKIFSLLYHAKKDLEQKTSSIYSMPCMCDQVHVWQTDHIIEIGVEENNWRICIGQLEQAAVTGHSLYIRHSIQTPEHQNHLHQILLHDRIIRDTTELHPNNTNKYKQGGWPFLQQNMETFYSLPEGDKQFQTLQLFSGPLIVIHGTSCLKKLSSSFSTLFVCNLRS